MYTTRIFGNPRVSHSCVFPPFVLSFIHLSRFCQLSQELFYANGTVYDQLLILNDKFEVDKTLLEQQGLVCSYSYHFHSLINSFVAVLRRNMGGSTSHNESGNGCHIFPPVDLEPRRYEKGLELDFTIWNQADLPEFQLAILER